MGSTRQTPGGETKPFFVKLLSTDFSNKLLVPPKYARLHGQTLGEKCILRPSHTGVSWPVCTKRIDNNLYFKKGWQLFSQHHSLQFGHLLIFRHVKNYEFDVDMVDESCTSREPAVFSDIDQPFCDAVEPLSKRWTKKKNRIGRKRKTICNSVALRAANEFISHSELPSFKKTMMPAYVQPGGYLHVPGDYAAEQFKGITSMNVKIVLADKVWTVNAIRLRQEIRMYRGWSHIARENCLREGDVCVFELIDAEDYTLKLTVFRHNSKENDDDQQKEKCEVNSAECSKSKLTPKLKEASERAHVKSAKCLDSKLTPKLQNEASKEAYEQATKFQFLSKHPSCIVDIKPCYLNLGYQHVPSAFVREINRKMSVFKLKLQSSSSSSGEIWTAMMSRNKSNQACRIHEGWRTFVQDNSIGTNNVCVLELIDKEDAVIKITKF